MSSAAVELLRGLLVEGWTIDYVRVSEPHASAILASGLLQADAVLAPEPGDEAGRIVVVTPEATFDAVVPV